MTDTALPAEREPGSEPWPGPTDPGVYVPTDPEVGVPIDPPIYVPSDVPIEPPEKHPSPDDGETPWLPPESVES